MNSQEEIYAVIKEYDEQIELLESKINNTSSFLEKHVFLNEYLLKKHFREGLSTALHIIQKTKS